ncbi:hypothetical protein PsorP6_010681 [Peronosclerospora sorghi]|uniref:Uncharacterized protein n=1 Tax=Peronosclerospora sorghi TaxID=230839 RepID=A0ACC0VUZ2_9STRA|nr:hypothetical protein PsorP6_010681 [Peronosclerospora sorghi]
MTPGCDESVFSVVLNEAKASSTWLLDSGANCHISRMVDDFCGYRQLDTLVSVIVAGGQRLEAKCVGHVRMGLGVGRSVKLTELLYVPHL